MACLSSNSLVVNLFLLGLIIWLVIICVKHYTIISSVSGDIFIEI